MAENTMFPQSSGQIEKINVVDPKMSSADQTSLPPSSPYFKNLRGNLTDDQASQLAEYCLDRFKADDESRSVWKERYANWIRLNSCQPLQERKSEPWEGASNVLMPVMTIANTQFWARAIDAIYPARDIVIGVPVDSENERDIEKAKRVGKHMSFQILYEMPNFYEGMSTSMMQLPMSGTVIRKSYYDPQKKTNVSEFIPPEKFVINYFTRYLDQSPCYTHIFEETYNDMVIKQDADLYYGVNEVLNTSSVNDQAASPDNTSGIQEQKDKISGLDKPMQDLYAMRDMLEMHIIAPIFDEKGASIFGKPGKVGRRFIVTIDKQARKIVRIVDPRYLDEDKNEMCEVKYFTKYQFLPSADGSFYGMGFGLLLQATNEAVNTIMNQLIDAGHLANTQSGFVNKRSGVTRGQLKMRRGEFTEVNVGPDGLQGAIMPLTFKEPSQVLFTLLEFLQDYANRVTTVSEVSTGAMPRSDTSATAMSITVEQGLKVFSAIYRSLHQSFGLELKKLFILNGIYLDAEDYFKVVGSQQAVAQMGEPPKVIKEMIAREDYKGSRDVVPASDPNAVSKTERIQKAQLVYQTMLTNPLVAQNPAVILAVTEKYLMALEENGMEVASILKPIQEQLMQQQQMQAAQMAQAQAMHTEALTKMQAMGAYTRQMQEGHVPPALIQGATEDMAQAQQAQPQ